MRCPKYQAWHKNLKKMQQVLDIALDPEFGGVFVWGKAYVDRDTGEHDADKDFWSWEDVELREFTGLLDRNGQEIWEGDIGRINHPDDRTGDFTNALGVVFWWDEEGGWYHGNESGRPPKRMWKYVEVIGNRFEHPELLPEEVEAL